MRSLIHARARELFSPFNCSLHFLQRIFEPMKKWIQIGVLAVLGLSMMVLATPRTVSAQTEKLNTQTTSEGETIQTPYITYEEFQAASLDASDGGKALSKELAGGTVTLSDLITISSLDEVTRLFGEPETLTHDSPYGQNILAFLSYEGLRLEYIKYDKDNPDSKYKLRELRLSSQNWSLTMNGTQLRPGMPVNQLSPAVRQTLDEDFSQAEDALGSVVVAKPGAEAKQGGELEPMRGGAMIHLPVEDGVVTEVQFSREL